MQYLVAGYDYGCPVETDKIRLKAVPSLSRMANEFQSMPELQFCDSQFKLLI